jgi:hypothetical protein
MLGRFGTAFGVAIATSLFAAYGSLISPEAFVAGFRPALMVLAGLSLLGALSACMVAERRVGALESKVVVAGI